MSLVTVFVALVLIALTFWALPRLMTAIGVPSGVQTIVYVFGVVFVVLLVLTYAFPGAVPVWLRVRV